MSAFSDYLEDSLLNHILRGVAYTPPVSIFVSLHTQAVGDDGTGIEVSGASYERKEATFTEVVSSSSDNAVALVWVNMPATTIVAVGLWDDNNNPSPGNLLFHGVLLEPQTLSAGDPFTFNIGDLDITLD